MKLNSTILFLLLLMSGNAFSQDSTAVHLQNQDTTSIISQHKAGIRLTYSYQGVPINEKDLLKILMMDPVSKTEARKAKQNFVFGQCVMYATSFSFGYFLAQSLLGKPKWGYVAASAGTFLLAGVTTSRSYYYWMDAAITRFNLKYKGTKPRTGQVSFGLTSDGVGLRVQL